MDYSLTRQRNARRKYALILCAIGLAINVLGSRMAIWLKLPLYLDNIGSALAAALGGSVPGMAVGFFTNVINGFIDASTVYYASLTVLIAIFSTWFANRGYYDFKKPWKLLAVVGAFALIGGGLGSLLTAALYGFEFGTGIAGPLARQLLASGGMSPFLCQFLADILIDLVDKSITVLIVAAVYNLLPEPLRQKLYFTGWQQTPLSRKNRAIIDEKRSRGVSLRFKIIVLVATGMIIIAVGITTISFIHFRTAAIDEQVNMANGVVRVVAETVDADRVDEFLEQGEAAPGYLEIEKTLSHLAESSEDIQYVYVYRIEEDGCHVVFDPDTSEATGANPGDIIDFDEAFLPVLDKLLAGKEIDPIISNEEYGWLLSIYKPIYDKNGVCQCYGAVDINMDHIATSGYQFLARVLSVFLGFFLLMLTLAIWVAEYNIILPINTMDVVTGRFAYNSEEARSDTVERIKQLDIHTGDEIENLYHSVVKTTEDTVQYIEYAQTQSETISRLQNGLILVLADMVESRDKCTGDHVRKTAAYTDIIMRQMKKEGIYPDQLTDEFMYDVVNSAPLHDIGKIQVPDSILNKPGKLTDEEFEIMKSHTTAGAQVIEHAMEMVHGEDSGYLEEAKYLAHFHHEKWNGKGYPLGLYQEEIPLSARIMAVADVFDALVSKRSYKEGFPFEKAMAIIEEGAGSHFDPNVAAAFMHASDEVRRVMNMNMGIK